MNAFLTFVALALARPELVSGRLELLGAPSESLRAEIASLAARSSEATWAGYAVPMIAGSLHLCRDDGIVHLDRDEGSSSRSEERPPGTLFVLYRLERGSVTEVQPVSSGCRIDAGARTLHWWEPVTAEESLRALRDSIRSRGGELAEEAVHAVALHGDARADDLLHELAAEGPAFEVREKAIFWLGALRGEEGFRRLASRFDQERDSDLREQIVFALHLSEAPGATEKLVEVARRDRDGEVREQALFWLAQEAGKLAASAIRDAVREDPELEVKKKAVFALSQLPEEEGVPLLVEVAESHPHPEVRKQAFFWLGQSRDPRALDLFERVLLRGSRR